MSGHVKRLIKPDRPKSNESILGFVLRLSEKNSYKSPLWILERAGLFNRRGTVRYSDYRNVGSFVFSRSVDLSRLAQLTGLEASTLDSLRYPQVDYNGSSTTHLICGSLVSKFMIRLRPAKICPECLRESNHIRALWDLAPVTSCPIHKRMLIDECPNCKRKINWSRKHVGICRCSFNWSETAPVRVEENDLSVSRHIYKLCGFSEVEDINKCILKDSPLLNLDLNHFLSSLFFIAGQFYGGVGDIKGRYLAPSYANSKLHSLLTNALPVFSDWPNRYFEFLEWYRAQNFSPYFKLKKKRGLYNEFGFLYGALYGNMRSAQFEFMRQGFEKYLEMRWDSGVLRGDSLISKKGVRSKNINLSEAMKLLKRSTQFINRLIKQGELKAIVHKSGHLKTYIIEIGSLNRVKTRLDQSLTLKEASTLLGVSSNAVTHLIENSCLDVFHGPFLAKVRYMQRLFDRSAIEELLKKVEEKIPKRQAHSSQTAVSFHKALGSLPIISFNVGDFVRAILEDEISPCGKTSSIGLSGFVFERKHVSEFLRKRLHVEKAGYLTFEEAAKELGVTTNVISFLIGKGLIQAIKTQCIHVERLINIEEIKTFTKNYAFITDLTARALKTSSRNISDLLIERNIWPICGPNVDGGPACIYRKSDLESVDLSSIVLAAKSNPRSKDRKTSLISVTMAAASLGIKESAVWRLVADGKLRAYTPHVHKDRSEIKQYFTRCDVNDYKGRLTDGRDLVTTIEAARILNQSKSWFYKRWVMTGRLKVVKLFQDTAQRQYFIRADVEKLIPFKGDTLTWKETSALLGISKSMLKCWRETGILKCVSGPKIDGFKTVLYLRSDVERVQRKELRQ